jgi:hypothetical protein
MNVFSSSSSKPLRIDRQSEKGDMVVDVFRASELPCGFGHAWCAVLIVIGMTTMVGVLQSFSFSLTERERWQAADKPGWCGVSAVVWRWKVFHAVTGPR